MKEVLEKCAALAHLSQDDAYKLEQDVIDMIEMVRGLPDYTNDEYDICISLQELRDDASDEFKEVEKLFENSEHVLNDSICVPKITGV